MAISNSPVESAHTLNLSRVGEEEGRRRRKRKTMVVVVDKRTQDNMQHSASRWRMA